MHLWPTKNLRDSFKLSYLKRLEWNYRRMQTEKDQQSSAEQKLLENENQGQNRGGDAPNLLKCEAGSVASLFQELLLVLSCCYCCFCCGGVEIDGLRFSRSSVVVVNAMELCMFLGEMDGIFGYMNGRFEVSLADSTMMWIVHYAMNKAQEKMKAKTGVIERLNEISKFYELAVMQLEGCLSIVHAETESSYLESNHEEVLNDLRDIKDRLQWRLKESELAIVEKDRELTERLEKELQLRHALELKERQLVSLGVSHGIERSSLNAENNQTQEMSTAMVMVMAISFQENIEAEVKRGENQVVKVWEDHWPQLMNEFTSLQHELATFHETYPEDSDCSSLSSPAKPSSPTKPSSPDGSHETPNRFSQKVEETDKSPGEEENEDGNNYVTKLIKNHESIIRQKSEELNLSKHGILQERKASYARRRKELNRVKEKIHVVTEKLDNFICRNAKLRGSLFNQRAFHDTEPLPGRKSSEVDKIHTSKDVESQRSAAEKVKGVSDAGNKKQEELIRMSHIEKEYNSMQNSISEDVCDSRDGLVEEFDSKSCNFDLEKQIQEQVYKYYLREVINEWNKNIEKQTIERKIRDDINLIVLSEAVRDTSANLEFALVKRQGGEAEECCLQGLTSSNEVDKIKSTINEDICMLIFRKTVDELQQNDAMLKEWELEIDNYYMEIYIREKIYQVVMVEALNDAFLLTMEVNSLVQDNTIEDNCSTMIVNQGQGEENLTIILLESLLSYFEAEENLMLSAKCEIKEQSKQLDLGSERGDLHEHEIFEDLITGEEQTFYSLTSKVENVLQQLGISKALLRELGTSLGHSLRDSEDFHNQMSTNEEGQLRLCSSAFMPLLNLLPTFAEFGAMVCQKFEMMTVRLEKMKCCLDPVIELVGCLRRKELLYQKAFIKRCQNLQKAEAEVDLLGDQVDALLTLLEKIYATLHQHAPALQQYFEVYDILELIKGELISGAVEAANVVT
ncbi:WPP domain-associated protein [Spatholobus suberectus]|nr:WPP domain-associated protein [Spatholobus suberectus]